MTIFEHCFPIQPPPLMLTMYPRTPKRKGQRALVHSLACEPCGVLEGKCCPRGVQKSISLSLSKFVSHQETKRRTDWEGCSLPQTTVNFCQAPNCTNGRLAMGETGKHQESTQAATPQGRHHKGPFQGLFPWNLSLWTNNSDHMCILEGHNSSSYHAFTWNPWVSAQPTGLPMSDARLATTVLSH